MTIFFGLLFFIGLFVLWRGVKISNTEAGRGALYSIVGFLLLLPALGKYMWDIEKQQKHMRHTLNSRRTEAMNMVIREMVEIDRLERARAKQEVLAGLNRKLATWYHALQDRREKLGTDAAEVASFNDEAAAYQDLLAVTKEEAAEIQKLQSK
jgi:hypothetical protein